MARPPAGPPPVGTSAVARREQDGERQPKHIANYQEFVKQIRREDRMADLRAMFGGSDELVERFLSVALASIAKDSNLLLQVTPPSLVQAVKDSATLGLEPTGLTGEAWIIPFGNVATLMPGWRGYLKRIRNSGKVVDIDCQIVFTNDQFEWGYTEKGGWFRHTPAKMTREQDGTVTTSRGHYWGAYAYAVMPSGFVELEVMPIADVEAIRDERSKSWKQKRESSPWTTDFGEMMRKTPLRRLAKRLPQSAVELLLMQDARVEQMEDQQAESTRELDVSTPRRAALAALATARGEDVAEPAEPAQEAQQEPEGAAAPVEGEQLTLDSVRSDEPPPPEHP